MKFKKLLIAGLVAVSVFSVSASSVAANNSSVVSHAAAKKTSKYYIKPLTMAVKVNKLDYSDATSFGVVGVMKYMVQTVNYRAKDGQVVWVTIPSRKGFGIYNSYFKVAYKLINGKFVNVTGVTPVITNPFPGMTGANDYNSNITSNIKGQNATVKYVSKKTFNKYNVKKRIKKYYEKARKNYFGTSFSQEQQSDDSDSDSSSARSSSASQN